MQTKSGYSEDAEKGRRSSRRMGEKARSEARSSFRAHNGPRRRHSAQPVVQDSAGLVARGKP